MEQMVRKASDNKYLHKDFHNHMNLGIEYLRINYGEEAVREYLVEFANAFYKPLKDKINENGLIELEKYFTDIYEKEEALKDIMFEGSQDELVIRIKRCPAITHMHNSKVEVSPLYYETILTVNNTIVEGTPFAFELISYDEEDGASIQRFYRKESEK
jgi:hypothetical protein